MATMVSGFACGRVRAGGAHVDLHLTGFDDDSMCDMDDANKDLQPVLGAKNVDGALADAQVFHSLL
jgi:hypothetical protein